jgi:hypothetical protein
MRSKLIACALLISVSSTALADPKDYKFHAVSATVKKGKAVVAVRLTSRGKPVSGAEIVKSEINMAPNGMTDMTSMVIPVPRTLIVDLVEIESGLDRDAA